MEETVAIGPNWVGPAIIAAVISSLVTAVGWIVGTMRETARDKRLREDMILDMQKALRAEIMAHLHQLRSTDFERHRTLIYRLIEEAAKPGNAPVLIPREKHDTVFQSMLPNIHMLPTTTVQAVVLYYSQLISIANVVEDMRSDKYGLLPVERQQKLYGHLLDMKREALRMGERANDLLGRHIRRSESGSVSTPDQAQSGPGSEA